MAAAVMTSVGVKKTAWLGSAKEINQSKLHGPKTKPRMPCLGVRAALQRDISTSTPTNLNWDEVRLSDPVALKEWGVTIEALAQGRQTILLRKGGIKEPAFKVKSRTFMLFPTTFHAEGELLKPADRMRFDDIVQAQTETQAGGVLSLAVVGECTAAWTTDDRAVLERLDELHMFSEEYLDLRLNWRKKQPVTIMEVRAFVLNPPLSLPLGPEHSGCHSWVPLTSAVLDHGFARPALDHDRFLQAQARLRTILGDQAEELQLPDE